MYASVLFRTEREGGGRGGGRASPLYSRVNVNTEDEEWQQHVLEELLKESTEETCGEWRSTSRGELNDACSEENVNFKTVCARLFVNQKRDEVEGKLMFACIIS